jgi:acyl-CoA thioesterase I
VAIRRWGHVAALLALMLAPAAASAEPLQVVALGDSLTAGFGLAEVDAFPAKLQAALKRQGIDVAITNAGVSGDTAADGLARLDWSVPDGADAVLIELGANDMLRGQDPERTRESLGAILERLKERGIPAMILGMRAAPNLGADYQARFDAIFPDLARAFGVPIYPFFLDGVAGNRALNQPDGLHPTARGVDIIVERAAPAIAAFLKGLQKGG